MGTSLSLTKGESAQFYSTFVIGNTALLIANAVVYAGNSSAENLGGTCQQLATYILIMLIFAAIHLAGALACLFRFSTECGIGLCFFPATAALFTAPFTYTAIWVYSAIAASWINTASFNIASTCGPALFKMALADIVIIMTTPIGVCLAIYCGCGVQYGFYLIGKNRSKRGEATALIRQQQPPEPSSLTNAVWSGKYAEVKSLLEHKANVNWQTSDGDFALRMAAASGWADMCEVLLKAGADKTMKYQGKTAAQWAVFERRPEAAVLIASWGQDPVPLSAIDAAPKEFSKTKLEEYKREMIHEAAEAGDVERVLRCLELKADVMEKREKNTNGYNWTPLMVAADAGRVEVLKVLIDHGAVIYADRVDTGDANDALCVAAKNGRFDVCVYLVNVGAQTGNSYNGKTAAEWAMPDRPALRDLILATIDKRTWEYETTILPDGKVETKRVEKKQASNSSGTTQVAAKGARFHLSADA